MHKLKIPRRKGSLTWDYDEEADILYISVRKPKKAVGLDVGQGVVVRYQEDTGEVVGLTIIGVKERSLKALSKPRRG